MKIARPESVVLSAVQALRKGIIEGVVGPLLSGEQRLASELGVSRRTMRSALEVLTHEGVISAPAKGKRRAVLRSPESGPTSVGLRPIRVLLPRPLDALSPGTQDFLRDLSKALQGERVEFAYEYSSALRLKRPAASLDALLSERPADLWLLLEPADPVAQYFRDRSIPAVVCGGASILDGLSFCAFDGEVTLRHAVGVLFRAGHRRVCAPMRYPRPGRLAVLREEFRQRGFEFVERFNAPLWKNDPESLRRHLRRAFASSAPPTAVVLNGIDALVVLYSTLLEFGLSVPKDVSVVASGSDPLLDHFRPKLTHYTTSHRKLATAMARIIRRHLNAASAPPIVKLLLMEYVRGASVGPPPA